MIFLGDFSIVKIFLIKLSCYYDNYFIDFIFGKYNGFVSKARVSASIWLADSQLGATHHVGYQLI